MKYFFAAVVGLIVAVFDTTVSYSAVIEGHVYLDANRNGRWDDGETGVPGVLVSDGRRVVATDASGQYRLDSDDARALLWITVPRDHRPTTSFWRWADGHQPENFGLVRHPQPADFCFIQITDTHIGNSPCTTPAHFAASGGADHPCIDGTPQGFRLIQIRRPGCPRIVPAG